MRRIIFLSVTILTLSAFVFSQTDDEVRRSSGLPGRIEARATGNPQVGVEVSGTLVVEGDGEPAQPPSFQIYVVAQNTTSYVFGKQRVRNKGTFRVEAVPTTLANLVLEINGVEFIRYPLNLSVAVVRQDISLTWKQISDGLTKLGVIDVKSFYQRSDKNQKLFDKGIEDKKNKKDDQAAKSFKEIVKDDPKDFVAWTELGNSLFESKPKEAQEAYQKALELKPDFIVALVNYGKLQLMNKEYESSIEVLTKALAVEPKSADVNHYLGEAYLGAKKGSKAVGYLNEAIRLAPVPKAELHLRLAALYNAAKLFDKAVAEYKMFLEKVPNHPDKKKLEQYISDNTPK